MNNEEKYMLAMYDVRGIQKYIFRTPDLKSAIGASSLVEGIIENALQEAINHYNDDQYNNDYYNNGHYNNGHHNEEAQAALKTELQWFDDKKGPCSYQKDAFDVQILYIGGGNAYVVFRGEELAIDINKRMSRYVLEKTYSLQLAIAMIEKTESYKSDLENIRKEMEKVKQAMSFTMPLGAIPIVQTDSMTGYPLIKYEDDGGKQYSTEALLKKKAAEKKRKNYSKEEKIIDSLRTKKGVDSNIAVVHIDGNNLGLRIRELMYKKESYADGVTAQRKLSYQIDHSYKTTFFKMKEHVEEFGKNNPVMKKLKPDDYYVIPVVVAGDDITYVCNARVALESVKYFAREISKCGMVDKTEKANVQKHYAFSICAGIAYANSHFPFHIAYDVAEKCCHNAKRTAKEAQHLQDGDIGNWLDFHICRNIQARNLSAVRAREYVTSAGEQLLTRPYFIASGDEREGTVLGELAKETTPCSLSFLENAMKYFNDIECIPRSFSKRLEDAYSIGEKEVKELGIFLESRGHKMPDGKHEYYYMKNSSYTAKWFDALEIMDFYLDGEGAENDEASEI